MIEIMEPTDFVVRLEFERGGYVLPEKARFMGRSVDFAMDMIDFEPRSVDTIRRNYFSPGRIIFENDSFRESVLIDKRLTECFMLRKINLKGDFTRRSNGFHVVVITKGNGRLESGSTSLDAKAGDKFFIPFATDEVTYSSHEEMDAVLAYPPE